MTHGFVYKQDHILVLKRSQQWCQLTVTSVTQTVTVKKIARWAYEYNRHGFWGKAISVPPPSINNDGSLM